MNSNTIHTVKTCPMCKSKNIEIEEKYVIFTRFNEYNLRCLNCGYTRKQNQPF